jgi:hypothetical protein
MGLIKDCFDKYGGLLLIIVICIISGFLTGLFITSKGGVYISLRCGENWEFKLGDRAYAFIEMKLEDLTDEQVTLLAKKIEKLAETAKLSEELRSLMDCHKGPFKNPDIKLTIKTSNSKKIGGDFVGACRNMEHFGYRVTVFKIEKPDRFANNPRIKDRMWDIKIMEPFETGECEDLGDDENLIWIGTSKAQEILEIKNVEELPEKLTVNARRTLKIRGDV